MSLELAVRIQTALREHFEGIKVVPHDLSAKDSYYDVFFLPDNMRREFVRFQMIDYAAIAEERGLPLVVFVFHTVSETQQHYPHVRREPIVKSAKKTSKVVPVHITDLTNRKPRVKKSSAHSPARVRAKS